MKLMDKKMRGGGHFLPGIRMTLGRLAAGEIQAVTAGAASIQLNRTMISTWIGL